MKRVPELFFRLKQKMKDKKEERKNADDAEEKGSGGSNIAKTDR